MTVRFLDEAAAELASAVAGYEAKVLRSKSQGLGVNFAVAVRDGLARIEAYPRAWQLIGQRVRRYRLIRFPYGLVYAEVGSDIVILALMHLHRKPDYWKDRLTQIF